MVWRRLSQPVCSVAIYKRYIRIMVLWYLSTCLFSITVVLNLTSEVASFWGSGSHYACRLPQFPVQTNTSSIGQINVLPVVFTCRQCHFANVTHFLTPKRLCHVFKNVILFRDVVHHKCDIFIWNWSNTMNVKSALSILMAWCFSTDQGHQGADQATSHYLSQWWLYHWRIYASRALNE